LRDPDRFDAWLHRLIINAAIDETRRRRRRVIEVEIDATGLPIHEDPYGLLADRDALDRVLAGLAPEFRALVVLHYFLGMPVPEAAESLGISLGAAKARLHRAIGSMREAFAPEAKESTQPARGGRA
jgi:RNA polymerase sigma-70 factor (ECF subfamily)